MQSAVIRKGMVHELQSTTVLEEVGGEEGGGKVCLGEMNISFAQCTLLKASSFGDGPAKELLKGSSDEKKPSSVFNCKVTVLAMKVSVMIDVCSPSLSAQARCGH